jgi:large subunit ribosomal protein L14
MCINVLGVSLKKTAQLGDTIVVSVKSAIPRAQVKKKEIHRAIVVRQVKPYKRSDGSSIRFDENAVVLINPDKTPKGTRIFGPIAREVREKGYLKIISMAQEVV